MPRSRKITIGAVIGAVPVLVGALWAFSVTAANYVISPHMADAKQRVHVMCEWAKVQNYNTAKICESLGTQCKILDSNILVSSGCYEDGK